MKILFAIAEAYPFAKVGGLADVGGALPKALARLGHDVSLVLPGYPSLGDGRRVLALEVPMGERAEEVEARSHGRHGGVEVYSLGNGRYFGEEMVYGGYAHGEVFPFILFSAAVAELAALPAWRPDVIHCNDWHTGLVAQSVRKGSSRVREALGETGTVLSIHNLAYQGHLRPEAEAVAGFDREKTLLARGIVRSDVVNTVSRNYLEEIVTPEHGMGLDRVLRSRRGDLYGILNGVDYEEFDPSLDPHILAPYDAASVTGKAKNKAALQEASGLDVDGDVPVVGMVARLVDQKGISILCEALGDLDRMGAQVVVMGKGEEIYKLALVGATCSMKNVSYHATSDEGLARRIYAGSDLFLAPSLFEPCGLGPLIALRYGSVPVVRKTGGLAETIKDHGEDPENGLGFTFSRPSPRDLVDAVREAVAAYRRADEWEVLKRRAMDADFSWERAARRYEELYNLAIEKRREAGDEGEAGHVAHLALVHHANQALATDGYDNREGISEVVEGYARVLHLHERYRVPANLHLSGTLIEACAWHHPWFLELVKNMRDKGLLELIGGTYSENIMPLFDARHNREQLDELLWLYDKHLGCPPGEVGVCWVPERVWDTEKLAPVLTDGALANGGYRTVVLDDRLAYPTDGPHGPRALFDAGKPYGPDAASEDAGGSAPLGGCVVREILGSGGLIMAPISAELRYWAPPRFPEHWRRLEETFASLAGGEGPDGAILVYADDLEKTAGVGPWDASNLDRYEAFLGLISSRRDVRPVLLSDHLKAHPPTEEATVEPGSYYELTEAWDAGEDYRGWSEDPEWAPYGAALADAEEAVHGAERSGADPSLVGLARKHLLASAYETAWHDPGEDGRPVLAPWARAVANHARACAVIVAAAGWFGRPAADRRRPVVEARDLDGDGEDEVIVGNEHLYAVLSPENGGRLVYLFALAAKGGVLVVGNPTDDWNWQEGMNRYMDRPANHPGALAEVGHEHDRYEVTEKDEGPDGAFVELTNARAGGDLHGVRKRLSLGAGDRELRVSYEVPEGVDRVETEICLSPDYYRLLREGRRVLTPQQHEHRDETKRGFRVGEVAVWVGLATGASSEGVSWDEPDVPEVGHGRVVRVRARGVRRFELALGVGGIEEHGGETPAKAIDVREKTWQKVPR